MTSSATARLINLYSPSFLLASRGVNEAVTHLQIPSRQQDTRQRVISECKQEQQEARDAKEGGDATLRERREPAPSLILSALLSVSWVASRSLFRNDGQRCAACCVHSHPCGRGARKSAQARTSTHVVPIFFLRRGPFCFHSPFSASQRLHLHFNKWCGKRTMRRGFLVSEKRNERKRG